MLRENARVGIEDRAQQAKEKAAAANLGNIGIGNAIDQPTFARDYEGTPSDASFSPERTLAATQFGGGMALPTGGAGSPDVAAGEAGTQAPNVQASTVQQAPMQITGRMISMGTEPQRQAEQKKQYLRGIMMDPNLSERERLALRYKDATGDNPPAGVFEKPAGKGQLVQTAGGTYQRVGDDNAVTPVFGADGKPLIGYHPPSQGGANAAPTPGDFEKTGADFLQTIPAQWRKTVEKIAHYDQDPTKVASMRGGNREMLAQWVNQVNPAYDAGMFTNRAPTRKAFTTGPQGQSINAINTAIGHLDQLTGLVDKLGNSSFVPGNKVWNNLQTMFGSDKVTNFDTLKDALAGEVARTLSGGQATVSGIAEQRALMNAYSSPAALAGYVKTLIPTMGSKLAALDYQYHQAMGENDSFSALSPTSKQVLTKFGFDPAHPKSVADTAAEPAQRR